MNKQLKENLQRYEAARATGSSIYLEPDEFTDIAEYYHLHGRLNEALEVIDEAIAMFPGVAAPLAFRARIAILIHKDVREAVKWVDQITDKNDLDYYYIVAEVMIANQNIDSAEQFLEKKEQQVDEEDLEDYYLDVAMLFADYACFDLAQQWLSKSSETEEADYREITGRLNIDSGHFEESIRIFDALIDDDPYNTNYWDYLASAQYLNNQLQASIESCDYALAIDPDDPDALLNKANAQVLIGNYDDAMANYRHFQQLQPYNEGGDMGIASILVARNQMQEALQHLQKAEKLSMPDSSNRLEIYRQLCLVNAQLGHLDAARHNISSMEMTAGHDDADCAILHGHLAMIEGQHEKAKKWFQLAMHLSDNSPRIMRTVVYEALDYDLPHYAHQLLRQTMASEKGALMPEGWAMLCLCDVELGLRGEFLQDLHQAITISPADAADFLADLFPKGMPVSDYENYARLHTELGAVPQQLNMR